MTAAASLTNDDFSLPSSLLTEESMAGFKMSDSFGVEFSKSNSENSSLVSNESEEEEDEFFARLTQRLTLSESRNVSSLDLYTSPKGLKVSGGSPQSTLGGIGSWSGRSSDGSSHNSPPATPFESKKDTLGVINSAAGQVERLQMTAEDPFQSSLNGNWRANANHNVNQPQLVDSVHEQNTDIYAVEQMKLKYISAMRQANHAALLLQRRMQDIRRYEVLNHMACAPLQQARVPVKANFSAIPLQRKESGTGVFIPRKYDADLNVPPRKKAVVPCALVPAKVVQALNTSIQSLSAGSRQLCNPIPSTDSINQQSFDALMARRRALLDHQQRSMVKSEDISSRSIEACLPQEWSY